MPRAAPRSLIREAVELISLISGEVVNAKRWGDERDADDIANEFLLAFKMPDLRGVLARLREAALERALDEAEPAKARTPAAPARVLQFRLWS